MAQIENESHALHCLASRIVYFPVKILKQCKSEIEQVFTILRINSLFGIKFCVGCT